MANLLQRKEKIMSSQINAANAVTPNTDILIDDMSFTVISSSEIEEQITSIKAEEITAISKTVIGMVMYRLDMGITATNDFSHKSPFYDRDIYFKSYDLESPVMKTLRPILEKEITEAFSIPRRFIEEGIVFPFFTEEENGLLDHLGIDISNNTLIGSGFSLKLTAMLDEKNELNLKVVNIVDGKSQGTTSSHWSTFVNLGEKNYVL